MKNIFFAPAIQKPAKMVFALAVLVALTWQCRAAIPPLERILPDDTLLVVAVPDADKFSEIKKSAPQARFWDDPAMKPFKDKFMAKLNEELITPLERELDIHFDDYTSLPHGQVTLAITRGSRTDKDKPPGIVLLVDAKDKSPLLKTNLASLRKKWVAAGKSLQTEKLHDVEFMEFPFSSAEMPTTLKRFFGTDTTPETTSPEDSPKVPEKKGKIVIGQFESLLIIGNTPQAVDSIATRLSGGSAPILADVESFAADKAAVLRDSPFFAWINVREFIDLAYNKTEKAESDPVGPMGMFKPEKIIAATGLNGLKSVAVAYRYTGDGVATQIFLRAPEATRQGLFKILAGGGGRESSPPDFVPSDVVKFQRWRLDGQKTWAAFEKMLTDISPSAINGVNFLIESANTAARNKDPDFDLRKNLIANLGNDFISYQKAPRDTTLAALNSPPSIFLIGTAKPEQVANALQGLFRLMSPGGPTEREFLGRKIYSVTVPGNPMGGLPEVGQPFTRRLNFVAASSYVALSTDTTMLEEYLRSSENPPKALRETVGLTDAAQKVTDNTTGWFGYENQNESMRVMFDALHKAGNTTNNASSDPFFAALSGIPGIGNNLKSWMDFSLLPAFDRVSKYFYFSVFAGSSSIDGLTFKIFAPLPPALK